MITLADLINEMDEEVLKLQTELISENDYQKLQNTFENQFVNSNSSMAPTELDEQEACRYSWHWSYHGECVGGVDW